MFIDILKPSDESSVYTLLWKTSVSSDSAGSHSEYLSEPILVEPGYILGIHYNNSQSNGTICHATDKSDMTGLPYAQTELSRIIFFDTEETTE